MSDQPKRDPAVSRLHAEVRDRFGVLPNFFRLAPEDPHITENLWGFAKFGYLDNPLPSLFKERLFVYLSRFCEVRYCIARHIGFLAGLGRPSGDRLCPPETVEQVIRLIRRELPRGDDLRPHLARLEESPAPLTTMPESDSPTEEAIFACATHVFLQTPQAARSLKSLRQVLDGATLQHLLVFLAFVRTAHFWTKVHPELRLEDDIGQLLEINEALAQCVVNDTEASACETTQGLLEELTELRHERTLRHEIERANEALRQRQRQLYFVTDSAAVLIAQCDAAGRYKFVNRPYAARFGLDPRDVIGKHIADVVGEEAFAAFGHYVRQVLEGTPVEFEVEIPYSGGKQFVRCAYTPERDDDGEVVGLVAAIIDITARKHAERERERLLAELQEHDRRKDEFLATLAHELRNPLAPLRNGLQVLRLAGPNEDMAEQARQMMERQLGHMVHLVDDLLDLSRISRDKIELRKERIDLAKAVQQAVETSRPAIEQAGHELTIDASPGPIYVDADVTRLAQVFSNLLNNAAKYTERGGRIRLSVRRDGTEAVVSVRDNGVGIPTPMLPKVFDIFTQVDRNLERSQGGLGIGLSIVKRLVEMHGGSVAANSDGHGMGSEFVVRLPVALSVVLPRGDVAEPKLSASRRRVLVVDDNRDAAVSLAMMLKLMGNEATTAHDGIEALDVAAAFRPDLILLDIGMPRLNGYETARQIRQHAWGKGMILVALTGWGQDEDRRKSQDAGFDSHMTKPIEPATLEKLLAGLKAETA